MAKLAFFFFSQLVFISHFLLGVQCSALVTPGLGPSLHQAGRQGPTWSSSLPRERQATVTGPPVWTRGWTQRSPAGVWMTCRVQLLLGEKQRVSRVGWAGWRASGPETPPRTLFCFPSPQGSLFAGVLLQASTQRHELR